jgi:hypothetical protein
MCLRVGMPFCPSIAKVLTLVLTVGQGSAKGQHKGQHT